MDLALLTPWIAAALSIIALLGQAKTFFGSEGKAAAAELKHLKETVEDQGKRLQNVENEIRHLPDRDAHHRVELALSEMNGRFAALEEKLKPIAATSARLHELLLEQTKR